MVLLKSSRCSIFLVLFSFLILNMQVAAAQEKGSGQFDGPAELPRVQVKSSLADTPAPGHTRLVKSGENLQQALDRIDQWRKKNL